MWPSLRVLIVFLGAENRVSRILDSVRKRESALEWPTKVVCVRGKGGFGGRYCW